MAPIDLFQELNGNESVKRTGKQRSSSEEVDEGFKYDEDYAKNYERAKRAQELMRLKDKYGEDYEPSEDSEESLSSEDSDAELITPEVDAAIFKTLARIKKADPKLYTGQEHVFQEEEAQHLLARVGRQKENSQTRKNKPMHLRDYQREALLTDKIAEYESKDSEFNQYQPTPAAEAEALREETKRAFHTIDDSEEGEDLLIPRDKALDEREQEEEEYQKFLIEQVGSDDINTAFQLATEQDVCSVKSESNLGTRRDENEDFLRNYLLGRGWIDKEAKKIPKYAEITQSNGRGKKTADSCPSNSNAVVLGRALIDDGQDDDEDEEFVEKAEEFEANYNFRFENAIPSIPTHSRSIEASARRKDDSRKTARDAVKARKAEEKKKRLEELSRLKELKRKEVVEKLEVIRKNAGAEEFDLEELDLDSDFDPDKHDMRMSKVFDQKFYKQTDPDGKPVWDDEIEIEDIITQNNTVEEMDNINFEPGGDAYDPTSGGSKRKKRLLKKSKKDGKTEGFPNEQSEEAPIAIDLEGLSPEERKKKLLQAVDEYHQMDYEDIIGDLPTRFKYAKVEATDLMTPSEILLATDAELNEVIGLKKLAPYRAKPDTKAATRKKKLKLLRDKLKKREWGDAIANNESSSKISTVPNNNETRPAKKRKGRKERKKMKDAQEVA